MVFGNILLKNGSVKKFKFTSSGGPWHGMALDVFLAIFLNS